MPKRPPMEIEFVASPRADAEEKHKALLALLARGVMEHRTNRQPHTRRTDETSSDSRN